VSSVGLQFRATSGKGPGAIANHAESIRKLVKKLGSVEQLQACYEAGPTGYVLYWQLAELGVKCEVIAPTREAAKQDQLRARHRLSKFLLRSGQRPAPGVKAWTQIYMALGPADPPCADGSGVDAAGLSAGSRAHG
jgi:hypothetical protein